MRRVVAFVLFVTFAASACSDDGDDEPQAQPLESTTTTERPTSTSRRPRPSSTTTTSCPVPTGDDLRALVDLDRDGRDEVWRAVGTGASTEIVELRRRDAGCAETPVTLDGAPAQFPIGGTVTHLDGIRCVDTDDGDDGIDLVNQLSATSEDGITYATVARRYLYADGALTSFDELTGSRTIDDADLTAYSTFAC